MEAGATRRDASFALARVVRSVHNAEGRHHGFRASENDCPVGRPSLRPAHWLFMGAPLEIVLDGAAGERPGTSIPRLRPFNSVRRS